MTPSSSTAAEISVPRAEPVGMAPGQSALPQLGILGTNISNVNMSQLLAGQSLQPLAQLKVPSSFQDIKSGLAAANRPDNRVKRSCINCKLAKTRCDNERPCRRCLRTGREATCVDSVHKKRGRKRSVNPNASSMKSRMPDMSLELDMFNKRQKLINNTSVNTGRAEVKHTLTYVETLLTVCNQQLERWNNKLRQANKLPQPLTEDMRNCKNSLKAYQWIAACMLKNLQNVVKISGSKQSESTEDDKKAAEKTTPTLSAPKTEPNKIDPREVFYGTLPIGVAVFSLQPSPFHPGNKPWVNKTLAVSEIT
ncbi:hypothetical protein AAMO2058_000620600 [Amorphochlora amoebiformis]